MYNTQYSVLLYCTKYRALRALHSYGNYRWGGITTTRTLGTATVELLSPSLGGAVHRTCEYSSRAFFQLSSLLPLPPPPFSINSSFSGCLTHRYVPLFRYPSSQLKDISLALAAFYNPSNPHIPPTTIPRSCEPQFLTGNALIDSQCLPLHCPPAAPTPTTTSHASSLPAVLSLPSTTPSSTTRHDASYSK